MASSNRITYNAQVTLSLSTSTEVIPIPYNKISYIYIDDSYEANVLPIIYMELLANDDMLNTLIDNRSTGEFNLQIKKIQSNSSTSIAKAIIDDRFSYIISKTTQNIASELIKGNSVGGADNFKKILIGLVSKSMINKMRKTFNGVYNNINESTLISLALEDTDPIIEKLSTNKTYSSIVVPPVTTRYQLLKYIFEKDPFYNTEFILFMDFDKTYLLSRNGKKVTADDGNPDSVLIDIHDISSNRAFFDGMEISDDHYYIDIGPSSFTIIQDQSTSKSLENLTIINENNDISTLDIDYDDQIQGITKGKAFVRMNNPGVVKHTIEANQLRIYVSKEFIDPSILTPNKEYNVINYKDNSKYNGNYILESKQVVFIPRSDDFKIAVSMTLKKVGKLNQATESKDGKLSYTKIINKAVTQTGKRSTTAAKKSLANVRKVL